MDTNHFAFRPSAALCLPFLTVCLVCSLHRKGPVLPETSTGRANSFCFYNIRIDRLNLEFYQNLPMVVSSHGLGAVGILFLLFFPKQTNKKASRLIRFPVSSGTVSPIILPKFFEQELKL